MTDIRWGIGLVPDSQILHRLGSLSHASLNKGDFHESAGRVLVGLRREPRFLDRKCNPFRQLVVLILAPGLQKPDARCSVSNVTATRRSVTSSKSGAATRNV